LGEIQRDSNWVNAILQKLNSNDYNAVLGELAKMELHNLVLKDSISEELRSDFCPFSPKRSSQISLKKQNPRKKNEGSLPRVLCRVTRLMVSKVFEIHVSTQ
jgi:hypothetical protein